MAVAMKQCSGVPALRARPALAARPVRAARIVCSAHSEEKEQPSLMARLAVPVATVVTAASLVSLAMPHEALAARSAGRTGSTAGFQRARTTGSAVPATRSSTAT